MPTRAKRQRKIRIPKGVVGAGKLVTADSTKIKLRPSSELWDMYHAVEWAALKAEIMGFSHFAEQLTTVKTHLAYAASKGKRATA